MGVWLQADEQTCAHGINVIRLPSSKSHSLTSNDLRAKHTNAPAFGLLPLRERQVQRGIHLQAYACGTLGGVAPRSESETSHIVHRISRPPHHTGRSFDNPVGVMPKQPLSSLVKSISLPYLVVVLVTSWLSMESGSTANVDSAQDFSQLGMPLVSNGVQSGASIRASKPFLFRLDAGTHQTNADTRSSQRCLGKPRMQCGEATNRWVP